MKFKALKVFIVALLLATTYMISSCVNKTDHIASNNTQGIQAGNTVVDIDKD